MKEGHKMHIHHRVKLFQTLLILSRISMKGVFQMNILRIWVAKILTFSMIILVCMGCAPAADSASPQTDAIDQIRAALELPELPLEFVEKTGMLNSTGGNLEVAKYQDSEGRIYSVDGESNLVVEMDARILLPAKHGTSADTVTFSAEELKAKAMTYFKAAIPDFGSLQSSLQYEEGAKGENYFFTWYAVIKPGAMNRPFAQIGLHQNGLLFAYYNTLSLEE
jgi:hypothetical protein